MSVLSRACGACARRPQRCRPAALLCAALLLAACGGGGGGGGGAAGGAAASANPGSATNEAQWRTALAALAQAPSPDPVRLEPAALAAYNELVARNWPHLVPRVRRELEAELRAAIGSALGGLQLVSLSGIALDIDAPPALGASAPGLQQTLELLAPAPPHSWSLRLDAVLGGTVPLVIGGVSTQLTVQLAVELEAAQVRVSVPLQFDFSRPQWPELRSLGTPQVQLQLVLRSPDPLLQQLLGTATALLDPVVRAALASAAIYAQYQLGPLALQAMPQGQLWGRGGPPLAPSPGAPDLERLGDAILDEIVRHHLPFGNLYPAVFDTPHQGGNLVGWRHHGDSAMWTGALLGMLAYRWDLSHEQRLMPIAQRLVEAYDVMSRVASGDPGLLARTVMPLSSPHAADILRNSSAFTGVVDGVAYAAIGDTSRDSYTGTFFGLGQAYHRMPALRAAIAPIVGRLLEHLEARDWTIYQARGQANVGPQGPEPVMTFVQAPTQVLAFLSIGARIDPGRWEPVRRRYAPLADQQWLHAWFSAHEVYYGYYGFHLEHLNLTSLCELETDPGRYRAHLRTLRILREALGHHQNAMFDAVWGALVPPAAAAMADPVRLALQRWTLRPRRGFTIRNSQDPAIAKTTYTTTIPNQTGGPNQPIQTGPRTVEVAVYPLPIEKRPSTAYLWSSSPFELDGAVDPHEQHPGLDLLLPYWLARNHGVLR